MNALHSLTETIERLSNSGAISEGDYLAMMNTTRDIYRSIPQQPEPTVVIATPVRLHAAEPMTTVLDRYFNLPPLYRPLPDNTGLYRWMIDSFDAFLKDEIEEAAFGRLFARETHDGRNRLWDVIMDRVNNNWKDLRHRDKILSVPAVRSHYLTKHLRERKVYVERLGFIWGPLLQESDYQKLFEDLRFESKVFHFSTRKHYNRYITCDKSKSHALELTFGGLGGTCLSFPVWTKSIQFGRTPCVAELSIISFLVALAQHENPDYVRCFPEEMSARIVHHHRFMRHLDSHEQGCDCAYLRMETSGITARTREKHRTYKSSAIPGFSLTYRDAINQPKHN